MINISDEAWEAQAKCLKEQKLKKKELLLNAGEVCDFVAFVEKGLFRFYRLDDGNENVLGFVSENFFATDYSSFLSRRESYYYIQALEDSKVFKLHYNDMQRLYIEFPEYERFGRLIAENIYMGLEMRNISLLIKSPEERYLKLLKSTSNIFSKVPQYMIASYLGITPEALSRIRKRLSEEKN